MKTIQIQVDPKTAALPALLKSYVQKKLNITGDDCQIITKKRSIDARGTSVKINLTLAVYVQEKIIESKIIPPTYKKVHNAKEVIIIGAGPAGLFAALKCLEKGLKPILIERGKDVRNRRRDIAKLNKEHIVDEDSNYSFGEGGAGTYSDGKLYTRSKKRGSVQKVLEVLVSHGASADILIDAHPHIGTNKLPGVITAIRNTIIEHGGQVLFEARVVDFIIEIGAIKGVITHKGDRLKSDQVILATGHSARDIYRLLFQKNIFIEAKPFALGVRVEHPQELIDQIQYKMKNRGAYLPPASYALVKQAMGRGVYSFCMCPGGIIAPCATSPGEVVTNGWSPSKRDQATANSGIVVEVLPQDYAAFSKFGPLAAMEFQSSIEKKAWEMGGKTQSVPAQRLMDFLEGKTSTEIPKTSYIPGTNSVKMDEVLPEVFYKSLRNGFKQMGQTLKGFLCNDAILHAPESRTSSPVRIPRDAHTLQHPQIKGLFPCGEGAGYAGGIVSAAIDGERCGEMLCD